MKRILLALLVLLVLTACQPQPTPAATSDVVQTAVVLTLTAQPTDIPPTQTPQLPTPTIALPTATLESASPTPQPPAPPPPAPPAQVWYPQYADQFIRYYYQNINLRNYWLTWSLLSDSFKLAVNGPAEGGYQGYVDFWNSVQRVDISSVSITGQSSGTANVLVGMTYNYWNGVVSSVNQPFSLIFDAGRNTWMFHSPTAYIAPATPSPQSFIYYYFDRINARDYGTTWSLLHESFINHVNPPSTGGYTGYVNFWNSVARLDIVGMTLNAQSASFADLTVNLVFNYTNGTVVPSNQLFHLIYDSVRGTWLFYSP